jgi:hypothetical protein
MNDGLATPDYPDWGTTDWQDLLLQKNDTYIVGFKKKELKDVPNPGLPELQNLGGGVLVVTKQSNQYVCLRQKPTRDNSDIWTFGSPIPKVSMSVLQGGHTKEDGPEECKLSFVEEYFEIASFRGHVLPSFRRFKRMAQAAKIGDDERELPANMHTQFTIDITHSGLYLQMYRIEWMSNGKLGQFRIEECALPFQSCQWIPLWSVWGTAAGPTTTIRIEGWAAREDTSSRYYRRRCCVRSSLQRPQERKLFTSKRYRVVHADHSCIDRMLFFSAGPESK